MKRAAAAIFVLLGTFSFAQDNPGTAGQIGYYQSSGATMISGDPNLMDSFPNLIYSGNVRAAIQDGGGQVYNVKYYGATGSPSGDDTVAVATAVNAACASGGVVYFPPGTYIVDATLIVCSGVMLQGANEYVSVLKAKSALGLGSHFVTSYSFGTASCGSGTYTSCPSDFGIRDLTIDANANGASGGRGTTGAGNAVAFSGDRCSLENVQILNAPNDGFYSEVVTNSTAPYSGDTAILWGHACRTRNVFLGYNGHNGFTDYGPPDSIHINTVPFKNGNYGIIAGCLTTAGAVCGNNNYFSNTHSWNNASVGFEIETTVQGNNIQSETNQAGCNINVTAPSGASGYNFGELQATSVQVWNGGDLTANGGSGWANVCGIKIDSPPSTYGTLGGNAISGLISYGNGGWGIMGTSGATKTVISSTVVEDNGLDTGVVTGGMQWLAADSKITGLRDKGNIGVGLDISASTLSFDAIQGAVEGNSTQIRYPTAASGSVVDVAINTNTGEVDVANAPPSSGLSAKVVSGATSSTAYEVYTFDGQPVSRLICALDNAASVQGAGSSSPQLLFTCSIPGSVMAAGHVIKWTALFSHGTGSGAVTYAYSLGGVASGISYSTAQAGGLVQNGRIKISGTSTAIPYADPVQSGALPGLISGTTFQGNTTFSPPTGSPASFIMTMTAATSEYVTPRELIVEAY